MLIVKYPNDGAYVFFGIGQRVFLLLDNINRTSGRVSHVSESLRFQRFGQVT